MLGQQLSGTGQDQAHFIEAQELARNILTRNVPTGIQVVSTEDSYYVDHGIDHIERVIAKLNALNDLISNKMNRKEAFIILVATYYHDIGMFIGRHAGENPDQTRREHHRRSSEAIQMLNDGGFLHLPREELEVIRRVIEAHRLIDLNELPMIQRIEGFEIRSRLLGAFLRIADSCDCDRSRAPRVIFDLFYENIPENSRGYWRMHFPVTDVTFEDSRASIVVSINFGTEPRERIENHRIAKLLKRKLENELQSVEGVFSYYTIPLVHVEIRDFSSGGLIGLSSLSTYENTITVTLCSDFDRVEDFIDIVAGFSSNTSDGIPLVVEIRPPEGPLFINTVLNIDSGRFEEMKLELGETLGPDLWRVSSEVIEKRTIRSGVAA